MRIFVERLLHFNKINKKKEIGENENKKTIQNVKCEMIFV